MSRKETILLVSRALAILQLICALMEVTYLPIRFMSFFHHASRVSVLAPLTYDAFYRAYYGVDIAFLLARTTIYLVLAFVFWNCGPWIEHLLLPDSENREQSN